VPSQEFFIHPLVPGQANRGRSEHFLRDEEGTVSVFTELRGAAEPVFHIALEVKTGQKGDPGGSGRGAVEEAATPVLRSQNGFATFLARNPEFFDRARFDQPDKRGLISLLPVIFTTAEL
jgi:hypothetical protein